MSFFITLKNCTDQCSVTILFDLKDDAFFVAFQNKITLRCFQ